MPVRFEARCISVILSGDVAELREEGTSVDEVLRRADQVLYRAKAVGRGQVIAA